MLFIAKKQLVPLCLVFIYKLFQSRLQVGQLKSYSMASSRSCSSQDYCSIYYACAVLRTGMKA